MWAPRYFAVTYWTPSYWSSSGEGAGANATWEQIAATWAATASSSAIQPAFTPSTGVLHPYPFEDQPDVMAVAAFAQAPAVWSADMDLNDDEPLLLSDLLQLVA